MLTIGIAVAEAISAAHQKGITHRDLKPANIMLGEGEQAGRIKVLGLRSGQDGAGAAWRASAATLTEDNANASPMTREGHILGTIAYMSPEQAEGKALDARSDLFSLGVVLYEMATGQRPFTGESDLSILSSILKDTPRAVTDINPSLPPDFARIVRRALAKDPERRYQSAKDLRNNLEDLRVSLRASESLSPSRPPEEVATAAPSATSAARGTAPSSDAQVAFALTRKHPLALAVAAIVLVLVLAGAWNQLWLRNNQSSSSDGSATPPSFAEIQITQLTTSGTARSSGALIRRAVRRVCAARRRWRQPRIRQTSTTSNVQIVAPQRAVALFGATFTPDTTSIDFVRQAEDGPWEIWRVPFLGGTAKLFIADVASPISWSPDTKRLAFLRAQVQPALTSQLIVAEANGGQERILATSEPSIPWVSLVAPWRPSLPPAWSPDARIIAVAVVRVKGRRRTGPARGQPDRLASGVALAPRRADRTGLAGCAIARAQHDTAAWRTEPVVPAAVSPRSGDADHQRSE